MSPAETVVIVLLAAFVVVQPWIPFAAPGGAARFARLPDDEAQAALDRAVRWDRVTRAGRTAVELAVGVVAVSALTAGLVAGTPWLAASAAALLLVGLAVLVRRRGRDTVLAAARTRGLAPSPRTRSATRDRLRRGFALGLVLGAAGAPLAYTSDGVGPLSPAVAGGSLVVGATLALIGLVSTAERTYGDEEPD